jgi:hypothetical protein
MPGVLMPNEPLNQKGYKTMKRLFLTSTLLMIGLAASPSALSQAQEKKVEKTGGKVTPFKRAIEGENVWVIVNLVKPDKRQQFEKFVFEIFWPGGEKLPAADRQAFKQTRVLKAVEPDKDGNFVYLFIMDPLMPSVDYSIGGPLKRMYGEQKANDYMNMLDEALAGPQIRYSVLQTLRLSFIRRGLADCSANRT